MNEALIERAGKLIEDAQEILITSHIRPDGDAIGSVLGLGLALLESGKQAQMVLADGVPRAFLHLVGADSVVTQPGENADLIVVLDSSDLNRISGVVGDENPPDLNIDHHVTNLNFAKLNLVDTQAVATAAILARCLPRWGLPINPPIAAALLTGIITDTLGFRTSNMNSEALRIAADLVDTGIDLPDLYFKALVQRSFESARYWGAGLIRLHRSGRIIWTALDQADRHDSGYPGRNDADLINFMTTIQDYDVAIIFVEQTPERIKVSWRAKPGFDISQIALSFGGGGHPSAAGAEVVGDMDTVQKLVLEATQTHFLQKESDRS